MPENAFLLTNFTAGELSPRFFGRVDNQAYFRGAARLTNLIAFPHGGVTSRPGSRFVAEVKDSTKNTRLIPFVFSQDESYILEFGDLYFRVYKDQEQIESAPLTPVEVATPYTASQIDEIQFTQSADVLFLAHPDVAPQEIQRTSDTAWTITDFEFKDGPFFPINETLTTLNPAAATGSGINITASAVTGINDDQGFLSTDVGRLIRISNPASGTDWGYAEIVTYNSTTSVDVDIKVDFATANATTNWQLGSWSDTSGWPQVVSFFQQRLMFAATDVEPQTLWGSKNNDFNTFSPTETDGSLVDDTGLNFTIASNQVNAVKWMEQVNRALGIGSLSREFSLQRGLSIEVLTPTNIRLAPETSYGSSYAARIKAVTAGATVIYLERADRRLRQYLFSAERDSYVGDDITFFAEHITQGGITDMAYQSSPDSLLWCLRSDGVLVAFTYEPDKATFAWHRHEMGGTDAKVKSLAVIPEETSDALWLIVERTVNGATVQYVEVLEQRFDGDDSTIQNAFYVDSGITQDTTGAPTTTVTGLSHLEGETVSVLTDGYVHPSKTVVSGAITLDKEAEVVQVGLGYVPDIVSMPLVLPIEIGVTMGKTKRINRISLRFYKTIGAKFGEGDASLAEMEVLPFRKVGDPLSQPVPLFTGIKTQVLTADWEKGPQVRVAQPQPLPMTILSIEQDYWISER